MKTMMKKTVMLAVSCICLGMALLIGGAVFGSYSGELSKIQMNLDERKIFGNKENADIVDLLPSDSNVQELEILVDAAAVELIRSEDADTITLMDVSDSLEIKHHLDGTKMQLRIRPKENLKKLVNIDGAFAAIVIPVDIELRELDMELNASSFEMKSMITEKLELDMNASSAEIIELKADVLEVNSNASSVNFEGDVEHEIDVKCNASDVSLQLAGSDEDFSYRVKVDAGSVQIEDDEYAGLKESTTIKNVNAGKEANLECSLGSIELNFES